MTRVETIVSTAINLALDVATAEVTAAFRAAEIRTILLKGAALRDWPSPSPTRRSVDVDLLVPPDRFNDAESVLKRLGFESRALDGLPYDRPVPAHAWSRGDHGAKVDLHRNIIGVGASPEVTWTILAAHTAVLDLGTTKVDALAPAARAMHVALHAAQHGNKQAPTLRDLQRAVDALPLELWADAAAIAAQLDASHAFAAGLRLVPSGAAIASALRLSFAQTTDVALMAATSPNMARGFAWLDNLAGPRAKGYFIARKLIPPRDWLRAWSPLARRGRLGLAATYVWRPVWLLVHAGPGFVAWRRARRAARA
ncbi:MAG: nucleotidyltransferase family protein, partial [Actinobacteria bacterium]|nr:nucleotidyltransferase family protein [Actinomycetota bacterium]